MKHHQIQSNTFSEKMAKSIQLGIVINAVNKTHAVFDAIKKSVNRLKETTEQSSHAIKLSMTEAMDTPTIADANNTTANMIQKVLTAPNHIDLARTADITHNAMPDLKPKEAVRKESMIYRLITQTPQAKQMMQELGISILNQEEKLKKIPQVMQKFSTAFQRDGLLSAQQTQALDVVFGDVEDSACKTSKKQGIPVLQKSIQELKSSNGTESKIVHTMNSITAKTIKKMHSTIEDSYITIGNHFLPRVPETSSHQVSSFNNENKASNQNKEMTQDMLFGGLRSLAFSKTVEIAETPMKRVIKPIIPMKAINENKAINQNKATGAAMTVLTQITGIGKLVKLTWNAECAASLLNVVIARSTATMELVKKINIPKLEGIAPPKIITKIIPMPTLKTPALKKTQSTHSEQISMTTPKAKVDGNINIKLDIENQRAAAKASGFDGINLTLDTGNLLGAGL